jgi:endonuclease YncB( thermonuclease family)
MATTKLLSLIQGKIVVCEKKDTDRYGRTGAICRASGEDLGAIKVREGEGLGVRAVQPGLR